jgi:ribose 5-phosphate isomerase B
LKIVLAADHAGYAIKELVKQHLLTRGVDVDDLGTGDTESVDYPDFGGRAAGAVAGGEADRGILVCGSGQGMCMVANKVRGVRAALAWSAEIARLSRQHNDANVLCLPGRFVDGAQAVAIVDGWLDTAFEGGRHARWVDKMMRYEKED